MLRDWWSEKRLPNIEYVVAVLLIVLSFLLVQGVYLNEDRSRRETEVEQSLRYRAQAAAEKAEQTFEDFDVALGSWMENPEVRAALLAQAETPMTERALGEASSLETLVSLWEASMQAGELPEGSQFSLVALNRVVVGSNYGDRSVGAMDSRLGADDWARAQGGLAAWTVSDDSDDGSALIVARSLERDPDGVVAILVASRALKADAFQAGTAPVTERVELLTGVAPATDEAAASEVDIVWPESSADTTIDAIVAVPKTTLAVRLRWDAEETSAPARRLKGLVILLDVLLMLGALFVLAVARPPKRPMGDPAARPVRSAAAWVVLGVCAASGIALWLVSTAVIDSYELSRFHALASRLTSDLQAKTYRFAATDGEGGVELLLRQAPQEAPAPEGIEPVLTMRDDAGGRYEAFTVQGTESARLALSAEPGFLVALEAAANNDGAAQIAVRGKGAGTAAGVVWLHRLAGDAAAPEQMRCEGCVFWSGRYVAYTTLFARPTWLTDPTVAYRVRPSAAEATGYRFGSASNVRFERNAAIQLGRHEWQARVIAGDNFIGAESRQFPLLLLAGVLATGAFLFGFTHARSRTSTVVLRRASSLIRRSEAMERKARAVLNQLPDGIVEFDEDGAIEGFNLGAEHLFDYPEDEMIGKHVSLLLPDLEFPRPNEDEDEAEDELTNPNWETVGRRRDGTEIPLLVTLGDLTVDDRKIYTACVSDTFSLANVAGPDTKELAHFEQALTVADDCLWEWDLQANRLFLSPQWGQLTGLDFVATENGPEVWFDGMHPDDFSRVLAQLSEHIDGRTDAFSCEYRIRRSDGSYQWVASKAVAVRDDAGTATMLAGSHTDISERKLAEAAPPKPVPVPEPQENTPSRPKLLDHLADLAEQAEGTDGSFVAVVLVDLNYFKAINDSLGSHAGDQVLAVVAERLQRAVPDGDFTLRLGADEFAVVLRGLSEVSEASRIAEAMRRELGYPITIGDEVVLVSATMGISRSSARHIEPEGLLRDAESALRQAKSRGRMQQEYSGIPGAGRFSSELLGFETALRRALSEQEFLVSYQPILSLSSGEIAGCEALIRWQHPERGLLLPVEFIQLAEDTGLLTPLTEWLLETVLDQAAEWRRTTSPNLFVSVNLAAQQLQEKELLDAVPHILSRTGADPELLRFEIPATPMLESAEEILTAMMELSAEGTHFMLDNFGTGCSSLTYLRRFPIRGLKMEKRFLRGISANAGSSEYLSRIIKLAHELNFLVSINGVEMPGQLAYLRLEGFDEVQGYHVSPPVDSQAFTRLLRDGLKLRTPLRVEPAAAGKR